MESTRHSDYQPKTVLWTARTVGAVAVLFLLFDVVGKLLKPAPVVDAFARQGMPIGLAPLIGILLLVLVAIYLIPRTNVLGAILLTGYFGGAVAVNLRAGFPAFEVIFPIIVGVLIWTPIYLLDERVRALMPAHR